MIKIKEWIRGIDGIFFLEMPDTFQTLLIDSDIGRNVLKLAVTVRSAVMADRRMIRKE